MGNSKQTGEINGIELDPSSPLNKPDSNLEDRVSEDTNPLSQIALNEDAQNTFDYIADMLKPGSGFGDTPQERLDSLKEEIETGDITPKAIENLRTEYERIKKEGESSLYGFVEEFVLSRVRNNMLSGMNEKARMVYEVFAKCPVDDHDINIHHPIKRESLEAYRGSDYDLALLLSVCKTCDDNHEPSLSRMHYDFGTFEEYNTLKANAESAEDVFQEQLQQKKMKPFRKDFTKRQRDAWKAKHGKIYDKLRRQKRTKERKFEKFCEQNDIIDIYTRVKGSDRFIGKITDNIWDLENLVSDPEVINEQQYSTAVKDYLGMKIIVSGERAKDKVIDYLHDVCHFASNTLKVQKPNLYIRKGTEKDYWGEPEYEEKEGRKQLVKGWKEKNGEKVYEGWKVVINYYGMDLEIQIQTPEMWKLDQETHDPHEERIKKRRLQAEQEYGIPHTETVKLFEGLVKAA